MHWFLNKFKIVILFWQKKGISLYLKKTIEFQLNDIKGMILKLHYKFYTQLFLSEYSSNQVVVFEIVLQYNIFNSSKYKANIVCVCCTSKVAI